MPATFINADVAFFGGYPASPQTLISGFNMGSGANRGVFALVGSQSGTTNTIDALKIGGVTIPKHNFTVTGATKANPCVITSPNHGMLNNSRVTFSGVGGMTQLNGNTYTVTYVDANSFSIGVDSTGYGTYTSGGTFTALAYVSADDWGVFFHLEGGTVPSGTNDVTIEFTSGAVSIVEIAIAVYSGMDSIANLRQNFQGGGVTSGGTATRTVTSATGDLAVWLGYHSPKTQAITSQGGTNRLEEAAIDNRYFLLEEPGAASVDVDYVSTGATFYPQGLSFSIVTAAGGGTTKKLKLLTNSSWVGQTVNGIVFANSTLAGTEYGEFTGGVVAAGTGADAGYGVLKVDASAWGGTGLADGTTVRVYIENATYFSPIWPGTVISE